MKLSYILIFIVLGSTSYAGAQEISVDSLINVLGASKSDTLKMKVLDELIETIVDETVWQKYNTELLKLSSLYLNSKDLRLQKLARRYYALSLNNKGFLHNSKGELLLSEECYLNSLKMMTSLKDRQGIAAATNNLGYVYKAQGNIHKALEYYHKSLTSNLEGNELIGIANCYNNIAIILHKQGNLQKAIEYNLKSLKISKQANDKRSIGITLNNIALIYHKLEKFDSAKIYLNQALKMQLSINDKSSVANTYLNFGVIDESEKLYPQALANYEKSLALTIEIDDKLGQANLFRNMASLYLKLNNIKIAFINAKKAYKLAREIKYLAEIYEAAEVLSEVHEAMGNHKEALKLFKTYIHLRDSNINEKIKKETLEKYYQFNYQRKAVADSIKNNQEKKLKDAQILAHQSELEEEQTKKYALYGGLLILVTFSIFIYNRFKVTQHQNKIIEEQKKEVESQRELADSRRVIAEEQKNIILEKSKEIIDSITYAKRLQDATLPSLEIIKKHFPESFVIYKPKDIVAGDFYWLESNEDYIFLAVADCTGHGVPGAMVSVVCINALYRAVNEFGLTDTGLLLDRVRVLVNETFIKSSANIRDGMDISLLRLPRNLNSKIIEIEWSGANNPIWIFKNENSLTDNSSDSRIIEVKPDKQPIGKFEGSKPFTKHNFNLAKGDQIYMFTDGYVDQFGGPKGKKFKYKQLLELITINQQKSIEEQSATYESTIEKWQGDLVQVDDICLMGIRL